MYRFLPRLLGVAHDQEGHTINNSFRRFHGGEFGRPKNGRREELAPFLKISSIKSPRCLRYIKHVFDES